MADYDEKTASQQDEIKIDGAEIDVSPVDGKTPDTYVPEGFDSQEEFLTNMRQEYDADVDFDRINRDQALDDKKFAAGEQWDPVVLEQRKGLPCLVLNTIPQFTAQLVGDWRESRKAIKVIPSNDEDVDVASVRADLIRSIEAQSRADRIYDTAFESLVQCGDGAFRISVEYARDDVFDQDIFIRPVEDCLSVVWDRFSVDPTGRDAKRVFVNDRIPKKEFDRKWPGKAESALDGDTFLGGRDVISSWIDEDSYRITEYWRLVQRRRLMALFQNGKIFEINSSNKDQIIAENGQPVQTRVSMCSYAQMHLVTGFAILAGPYEYRLNRVPIVRMSGRVVNIGGRRVRYGLVRMMKDVVRLKNFWRSVAAEQLGYAPKAKWIAPESAVEGREEAFRTAHNSRDPLLVYNDGAESPPELIPPPGVETALLNEANVNTQDMKDITGIHDASLGIRSNETSGRAIQARQKEGDIASLTFYDNGNAAVLEAGDVINQLIPQIYDGTRVIRTIGEDESMKFQRINDPMNPDAIDLSVGQFDTVLATGTSYTTRRAEGAQALMDMVQVAPEVAQIAGDLIAKNMDFPGAEELAKRWKKAIPPQFLEDDDPDKAAMGPVPTPEQLQEMQMQMAQLQQENQQLKSDKSIDLMKIEIDKYNAETQRIKALSDHEVDANDMEMNAIQMILDGSRTLDEHDMRREEFTQGQDLQRESLKAKTTTANGKSTSTKGKTSQSRKANG